MEEKKFLESIEDGELDIAAYARSWEEGDNVTVTCDLLFAMGQAVGVFNEQKAEIERLTEEKQSLIGRKAGLDYSYNQVMKQNAKLKKQVDELKEQKGFWEGMHDRVCSELEELQEEKSNTDLVTQIYVLKNKLEQAVKDTAKEIYEWLLENICESEFAVIMTYFRERYGVEVK